jgi:predicted pyridoxine 5'-phosphate oxidase superfamily flavin-nucleotide-binding protein
MSAPPDEVMFSASVRTEQSRRGSRERQARRAAQGRFQSEFSPEVMRFIGERNSLYFATASADGQPYVQHRGGPVGFLHVLDARTLALANYAGNAQYITLGNLAENERAFVFLMDYAAGRRLKLWGRARVVVDDPALLARLADAAPEVRIEQALVFTVLAWDWNCSQHIPRLVPAIARQTREGE